MGWRELGFPGEDARVALVVARSKEYSYVHSLPFNDLNWMSLYDFIKDH